MRPPVFYWHLLRSRFAEALAQSGPNSGRGDALMHYAHYRLGLYRTAADIPAQPRWYSALAGAVSLAACGRTDEAARRIHDIVKNGRYRRQRAQLASALAPYLPALALQLTEGHAVPTTLRAALLMRTGQTSGAARLLAAANADGSREAELPLFRSNADPVSPQQQLQGLNEFLGRHGLRSVALRDPLRPPGAMNLVAAALPPVDGPLVGVVMTAYRAAPRIAAALESLQRQSWRNLDILVVDDASDDDTADIVRSLALQDRRIRYLRLPRNAGTFVAKNIGLQHVGGEFVTCHDADDWAHPERIHRQVAPLLRDDRLVFTTSHWVRMQDDGIYHARPVHPLMRLNPASPLFRKAAVLRSAGAWDCVRTGADSEFHARLKLVFGPRAMRRIPLPLTLAAHHPGSLMTARATGYDDQGLSPTRLAYWEAWGHWHIAALRAGTKPVLPGPDAPRRFAAPPEIDVPADTIAACRAAAP